MIPRSPLPRVCIALGCATPETLLTNAHREIADGGTFLEIRLDYLPDPWTGIDVIRKLRTEHPHVSLLATCRHADNNGHYKTGDAEEQLRILLAAADADACCADLEIESVEKLNAQTLDSLRARTCFVASYHNFETTPPMANVVRRMKKANADVIKIVTTARKPSDITRVLAVAKDLEKGRHVLLCMGETGMPSRVLAPQFGSAYTYAAPAANEGTAPGQISARQLRHLYRIEKLARTTKVHGVIADPVRHSMSPAIHNRAFQARRFDGVYLPFLVAPAHLRDFMTAADELPVCGFSVTIPHKQKIARYLDCVDPLAKRIGAVNTVWKKAGRWRGTNTDVAGVIEPLARRIRISRSRVLIAGTGGAARGAAFALADAGAKLAITGRTADKVRALARVTGGEAFAVSEAEAQSFDAVVHATPLGMFPHGDGCFFEDRIPASLVFDMVYNPLETALLRNARAQGLEVIRGLEMFVEQAAHQFQLWTGETAPRELMERTVLEALTAAH